MATTNYLNKSLPQLKAIAVRHFHKWIRTRDEGLPCISCGNYTTLQAGHFHSAGNYPITRFNPDNVNGQCKKCNYFLAGNLIHYQIELINRIGEARVIALQDKISLSKQTGYKYDRFFLIEIIETYKAKNKRLK